MHKESLTIEGGPIPCIGGIFLDTSTEARSISEYKCGLDDLTLFLLQQRLSKYIKQSVRSLSQKISREATFYGALMR